MAKRQKYIACITRNGISEAIYVEWFKKHPEKQTEWEKTMRREHPGCLFEEKSETEVNKGTDRFGKFLEKEKDKKQKEMEKILAQANKQKQAEKEETKAPVKKEEKPKKKGRKKKAISS